MIYFLIGFAQIFLVSTQTRNYTQGRYVMAFLGSLCIGALWLVMVRKVSQLEFSVFSGSCYVLGNAAGGLVGMYLHKRLKKKDVEKW